MRDTSKSALVMCLGLGLIGCEPPPAGTQPQLRTAATHPIQYYISLPAHWSKSRTWPVVITVAGSGKEWESNVAEFARARDAGRYPFIIATPLVVTNGGRDQRTNKRYTYPSSVWDLVDQEGHCQFDLDGVPAIVADVAKEFHGQPRAFLTGFSGGGQIAIALAYLHPESFRGAGIAASNYSGRCITEPTEVPGDKLPPQTISTDTSRVNFSIKFFNGSNDRASSFLIPQRDWAMRVAKEHGFNNVESAIVRGAGHEPMTDPVLAFFNSQLKPNER